MRRAGRRGVLAPAMPGGTPTGSGSCGAEPLDEATAIAAACAASAATTGHWRCPERGTRSRARRPAAQSSSPRNRR